MFTRLVSTKEGTVKTFSILLMLIFTVSLIIWAVFVYAADSVTLDAPTAGQNISGSFNFTATATGLAAANATFAYRNSSGTWVTFARIAKDAALNPTSFSVLNDTGLLNGGNATSQEFNVTLTDTLYVNRSATITGVNIDNAAPVVSNTSNTINSTNSTSYVVDFYYNVTDNFVVANCSLYVNGTRNLTVQRPTNATSNNFTVNFSTQGVGKYFNISVNCTDYVTMNGSTSLFESFFMNTTQSLTVAYDEAAGSQNKSLDVSKTVLNATYRFNITNNGSITDTFSLVVRNYNNTNVASLNQTSVTLAPLANASFILTVSHDTQVQPTFSPTNITINSSLTSAYQFIAFYTNFTDAAPAFVNSTMSNGTYQTSSTVMLNYSVDDLNLANCTLYTNMVNGTFINVSTDTNVTNGTRQFNVSNVADNSSSYNWSVRCVDNSSQVTMSSNFTIKLDTAPPLVFLEVASNANNTDNYTTKVINFYYNASDGAGNVSNCSLMLRNGTDSAFTLNLTVQHNSSQQNSTANTTRQNLTITLPPLNRETVRGNYSWYVNCTDDKGNSNATLDLGFRLFNVTEYGLNITATRGFVADNQTAVNRSTEVNVNVTYTLTVTNNGSQTSNYTLELNTTSGVQTALLNQTVVTLDAGAIANVTLKVTNGTHGNYSIQLNSSNERNAVAHFVFSTYVNVTDLAPTLTITQAGFANNTYDANGVVNFTVTVDDLNPNNCTLFFALNGTNNVTLNETLSFTGLAQNGTARNFSRGSILPDNASGFYWNVSCRDASNNEGVSQLHILKVDTAPPSLFLETASNADNSNNYTTKVIDFFYNVSDSAGIVRNCSLVVRNGTDSAFTRNLTVQNPTNSSTTRQNLTITFPVLDRVPEKGNYSWYINCTDDAGKSNSTLDLGFRLFNVSEYGANLTASAGQDISVTNRSTEVNVNTTYTLTITNNGSQTATFTLGVNTTGVNNTALLNQTALTLNLSAGGSANVTLKVANNQSNNYTIQVNVTSDLNAAAHFTFTSIANITDRAPLVTISAEGFLNNTFDANGNVSFTVTVDDLNPSSCNLYGDFNGTNFQRALNQSRGINGLTQNGTALNFSVVTLSNNATGYNWKVNCTDASGNWGQSQIRLVKVDSTNPNVTLINVTGIAYKGKNVVLYNNNSQFNGTWFFSNVSLDVRATVVGLSVDTVILYYNLTTNATDRSASIIMTSGSGNSYNATLPDTLFSYYQNVSFAIRANNSANNTNFTNNQNKTYLFTIDNRNPSPALSVSHTAIDAGQTFTMSCLATDDINPSTNLTIYTDVVAPNGTRKSNAGTSYSSANVEGDYTVHCLAVDLAGNNGSVSKIVTAGSSGTGGGGGGGGGSGSGGGPAVTTATETHSVSLEANTPATVKLTKTDHAVSGINVETNTAIGSVSVTVNKLSSNPVSAAPGENVYTYLEIKVPKLTTDNLKKAVVEFRIEKKWLSDNNLDKNTVMLKRYAAGKWNSLDTSFASEDATYVNFKAKTPGFSYFAVTAKVQGAAPEVEEGAPGEEETQEAPLAPAAPSEEKAAGKAWVVWLVVVLVVAVAAGLYYYYRKRD